MSPAVYETTQVKIDANGHRFTLAASKVKFDGFMTVYVEDDEEKDNTILSKNLEVGEVLKLKQLEPLQHFTQPPAHYTAASLVR